MSTCSKGRGNPEQPCLDGVEEPQKKRERETERSEKLKIKTLRGHDETMMFCKVESYREVQ